MTSLFDPLTLRGLTLSNRMFLSPMCQYMCEARDGVPTTWHEVHYGARATGGFGLIIAEATAVVPEGRISAEDCGLWNDTQRDAWARIVDFVHAQGAAMGVELAHAGRKASVRRDHPGPKGPLPLDEGGWETVGPSALGFTGLPDPRELTVAEIAGIVRAFADAAVRADEAGFDVIDLHAAHGYLIAEFLSPFSNHRTDEYGGDFEGRTRLLVEVVDAVRAVWPESKPLFVRLSATEWLDGGWTVDDSVRLAGVLREHGVDLMDVSSGGNVLAPIPTHALYQVPLARAVRATGLPTAAVGRITDPAQAQGVLDEGSADAVLLGRVALREPSWPLRAAAELGDPDLARYPNAYLRGRWPSIAEPPER